MKKILIVGGLSAIGAKALAVGTVPAILTAGLDDATATTTLFNTAYIALAIVGVGIALVRRFKRA